MHEGTQLVSQPEGSDRLILLFHGVGASAQDLSPLGQILAKARKLATVVSVEAPHPSQLGRGKEWFSVIGITEANRPQRIAQAMPLFLDAIRHWQNQTGIGPAHTVLIGFSQGAIMALASTQSTQETALTAHEVISLAGRLAEPVRRTDAHLRIHLIHGDSDTVVLPDWSIEANEQFSAAGVEVTLNLVPGLGHGIDERALHHVLDHLPPA